MATSDRILSGYEAETAAQMEDADAHAVATSSEPTTGDEENVTNQGALTPGPPQPTHITDSNQPPAPYDPTTDTIRSRIEAQGDKKKKALESVLGSLNTGASVETNNSSVPASETPDDMRSGSMQTIIEQGVSEPYKGYKVTPEMRDWLPEELRDKDYVTATDVFLTLNKDKKPLTKEERVAEEKKHKRNQIFNAIGDGLSALSNLYFTTKGAPSMYRHENSLQGSARERYEKLKKEREASDNAYYSNLQRVLELDRQMAEDKWSRIMKQREFELRKRKADRDDERAEKKDYRDDIRFEWESEQKGLELAYNAGKLTAQELDIESKKLRNKYQHLLYGSQINKNNRANTGSGGNRNIRSKQQDGYYAFPAVDENGKVWYYHSSKDADYTGGQSGRLQEEGVETGSTSTSDKDSRGVPRTRTTTKTKRYPETDNKKDDGLPPTMPGVITN